jgi:Zn-dependent metalloprotease
MKTNYKTRNGISILWLLLSFLISSYSFSQENNSQFDIVDKSSYTNLPNFIKLKSGSEIKETDFSEWVVRILQLPDEVSFKAYNTERDELGYVHTRYLQYFNEFPVNSSMLITHSKNGLISSINGDFYQNFNTEYQPLISEEKALEFALLKINAQKYKWENKEEENEMKEALNDPSFSYAPTGELVIAHVKDASFEGENMRLAFKFNIYAELPLYRAHVFVDARTGEVILEEDLIHYADVVGTANTKYSGNQTITCDNNGTNQYRLRETGRGNGISTFNLNNSTSYSNTEFTNNSATWNITGTNQVATDAHFGAEKTYDYFLETFNRNSIDGNGFTLLSYVHYGNNFENAFWDGNRMTYGDGNSSNGTNPFTGLDLCGHEVTHGLTSNTAQLGGSGEPGSLNEGFSDIFGACIEAFARPNQHDWIMGSDFATNNQFKRNMSNPNAYGQPDTYQGTNWDSGGQVHKNNGPCIYWFYLLCEGGSGTNDNNNAYNVTGITMDKASKIAYRALTVYFTSNTNYSAARGFAIQAAIDLYGSCSQEVISTTNAWYAVGVGAQYVAPAVNANFSALQTNSCNLPVTIQFNNTTANGSAFTWDFGDGTTSTSLNPSHTYTEAGTYTISLNAIGCNGTTTDSEVKSNYIEINPPSTPTSSGASRCGPGAVNLSASGSGTLIWKDAAGNVVNTGANFTTPNLANSTTYYVSSQNPATTVSGGPTSSSIGASANFTFATRYLEFNVLQPCILKTVNVTASGTGNRTIQLRDSLGNNLDSLVVNIANGSSTITLNFNLVPGQKYQLGLSSTSAVNLVRNSTGAVFPYNIGNFVTITGTDAGGAYYYFYYNWVLETESCQSNSVPVLATINTTQAPSGSASQTFCSAATLANLSVAGSSIQWYASSTGGSALANSTSLVNGTTYYASQTVAGCESPTRFAVTVSIGSTQAPSGSASQTFCSSATLANLSVSGNSIQWYASSTGGSALASSTSLVNETTYYASQTVAGCESPTRFAVTVSIGSTQAPSGSASQTFCSAATLANLSVAGSSIQWYASSTGGSALANSTSLVNGTTYYASQTVAGCESPTRFAVTVSIVSVNAPTGPSVQEFCESAMISDLSATGNAIVWYSSSTDWTALPNSTDLTTNTIYYASQSNGNCESATRLAVAVIIHPLPIVTMSTLPDLCTNSNSLNLTHGSPAGGLYSGSNVSNGVFNPASASIGTNTIHYSYTDANLCTSEVEGTITVDDCAGIDNLGEKVFLIYPNPANEFVFITSSDESIKTIEMYDNAGRLLFSKDVLELGLNVKLDIRNYSSGIYTLRIKTESSDLTQKIVINK